MDDADTFREVLARFPARFLRQVLVDDQRVRHITCVRLSGFRIRVERYPKAYVADVMHQHGKDTILGFAFHILPTESVLHEDTVPVAGDAVFVETDRSDRY